MSSHIDIEEILSEINNILTVKKYNRVLLQFPDGLKPYSKEIYDYISKNFPDLEIFIWFGSNFGGCDIPVWLKIYNFDAILHFGHTKFVRSFGLNL